MIFRPRGLAGALLVIKVAGALAEQGKSMAEIVDVCQKVREQLSTIGISASGVCAPGQRQSFEVKLILQMKANELVCSCCSSYSCWTMK